MVREGKKRANSHEEAESRNADVKYAGREKRLSFERGEAEGRKKKAELTYVGRKTVFLE